MRQAQYTYTLCRVLTADTRLHWLGLLSTYT